MRFLSRLAVLCLVCSAVAAGAEPIPFGQAFKIPAEEVIWAALHQPVAREMELAWQPIDPRKDPSRPDDFWRHWPTPFSPFYAGLKLPAEAFTLMSLYPNGSLVYPHATYEGNPDYETFFDLHESLAWLYAFDSPGNPFYKSHALRLRAQQLALSHLIGMTQAAPEGNIIGGWTIQYGNCVAWSAHTLRLLDQTEPLDPKLKTAWIDCLDHILRQLDQLGSKTLETGMGHWNLWPVCGAFFLWQASGREEHRALFEKWARVQLEPDAFTSGARYVSGVSPVGYVRYSGVDLGYNGQAKNWMAPLFVTLGPDSIVGDFARRQYRFASFVSLEEPDGSLSSPQHMNSHSTQPTPYEQWANHKHIAYAVHIPDAVPFATRLNPLPSSGSAASFIANQEAMAQRTIKVLPPMAFGIRSYPSNYLHLPPALAFYPKVPTSWPSIRTRPHEHLAYAQFFPSPIVRDEWFMRRLPGYHATLFAGPCKDEVSNAGGRLNAIGSGGLSHVWTAGGGTMLLAYSDLSKKPAMDGDYDTVWSQLPINALVARTTSGKVLCTGWTGALMTPSDDRNALTIEGGIAKAVRGSYGTPLTDRVRWTRRIAFAERAINVEVNAEADEPLAAANELLPVAFFKDTRVTATTSDGRTITAPWQGERAVRTIEIRRTGGAMTIRLERPLPASWAAAVNDLSGAMGSSATVQGLRFNLQPGASSKLAFLYSLALPDDQSTLPVARVRNGAKLSSARIGTPFALALEASTAQAAYWSIAGGALPDGLTLDRCGELQGTPTRQGTFSFSLKCESPYAGRPFNEPDASATDLTFKVD